MSTAPPRPSVPAQAAAELIGQPVSLLPLTPEAGARRYFRAILQNGEPSGWLYVTSDTPPPRASETWLRTHCSIRTPLLGPDAGDCYLVEDLGDRHLVDAPSVAAYAKLLEDWRVFTMQTLPADHPNTRFALDHALFVRELSLFHEHWVLGFRQTRSMKDRSNDLAQLDSLAVAACGGPQSTQHRDFHSRNLLLPDSGPPAWIDHQDLRSGPLYYDLASLATDAYLDLPADVAALLEGQILALTAIAELSPAEARRQYCATALQRVLKALGTFAMLLGRGRQDYAAAERRAYAHAMALLDSAPEWEHLCELLTPSR